MFFFVCPSFIYIFISSCCYIHNMAPCSMPHRHHVSYIYIKHVPVMLVFSLNRTKLPDPSSEGYEEKEKFAQMNAEEIERCGIYQARIAKELKDGDEEALYSAVHRGSEPPSSRHQESNSNSGKNRCAWQIYLYLCLHFDSVYII